MSRPKLVKFILLTTILCMVKVVSGQTKIQLSEMNISLGEQQYSAPIKNKSDDRRKSLSLCL